jgi:hypothetical protein
MRFNDKAFMRNSAIAVICVFSCIPLVVGAAATQSQDVVTRRARIPLQPLAEQLRPGDRIVEFYIDAEIDQVLPERPLTKSQSLRLAVAEAEQVVLVRITSAESQLIEGESWIATRLAGTVTEVIKASGGATIGKEATVSFFTPGGEMKISGVLVRAGSRNPYQIGLTYLAFLQSDPNPAHNLTSSVAGRSPLLVDGGRLKALTQYSSELDGVSLAEVRAAAKK